VISAFFIARHNLILGAQATLLLSGLMFSRVPQSRVDNMIATHAMVLSGKEAFVRKLWNVVKYPWPLSNSTFGNVLDEGRCASDSGHQQEGPIRCLDLRNFGLISHPILCPLDGVGNS